MAFEKEDVEFLKYGCVRIAGRPLRGARTMTTIVRFV